MSTLDALIVTEFHEALRFHLLGDEDFVRMIGPRLYHLGAEPRTKGSRGPLWPRVVFHVSEDLPLLCLAGEAGSASSRLVYTIDAVSARQARQIKELIRRRLNGLHNVTIEGVRIQHCLLQASYEVEYEPEPGQEIPPYAMAVEFDVMHVIEPADPQPENQPGGGGGGGDTTPPTAAFAAVPSPLNSSLASLTIVFSEPVVGLELSDFTLTLNGGANLLGGGQTLTASGGTNYEIGGLAAVTAAEGAYALTLPSSASVTDLAGNGLAGSAVRTWTVDTTAPTVAITAVSPDPRDVAVGSIAITFSEPVTGFSLASLELRRDGGPNLLTPAQTLTSPDDQHYTLSGLVGVTAAEGSYGLVLSAAGIADSAGNALAAGATETWEMTAAAPALFANPSPETSGTPNFLYGRTNLFDVGDCGDDTYRVDGDLWDFALAICWYNYFHKENNVNCAPNVDNDPLTGLPTAKSNWAGSVNRIKTRQPTCLLGPYVTLAQIATYAGLDDSGLTLGGVLSTWPRSRPLWDSRFDALGAAGWPVSDIGSEGRIIPLDGTATAGNNLAADDIAEIAEALHADNPECQLIFSDNHDAVTHPVPTRWANQMARAGRCIERLTPLNMGLVCNVTLASFTGVAADGTPGAGASGKSLDALFDAAESAGGVGLAGIYVEGIGATHTLRSAYWDTIVANIKNWLARSWPGGGKRMLLTQPAFIRENNADRDIVVGGFARRVRIVDATIIDEVTIEFETETPHYLDDTSAKIGIPWGLDTDSTFLNETQPRCTSVDATRFRIHYIGGEFVHGATYVNATSDSWVEFPFAGYDTDFGLLHAIRSANDATFWQWGPDETWTEPLWQNDIDTFGEVVPGSLEVVSTHMVKDVTGAEFECVKEIKYQFASGPADERWHHVDFRREVKRRWKASS